MEDKATLIDSLFEKAEMYAKTNFELYKLHAIDKSADIISTIAAKLTIIMVVFLSFILLNIGLSIWIGELLGKIYYGFFIISAFYIIVTLILYYNRSILLKAPVNDSIILEMINEKKDEKNISE
jgi:hypothetical protein